MKRALVTLGHPDHAGMLRALRILDDAAPRHGWELRFVLAGPHPQVAEEGLAAERVTYLPALRRWRAWPARLALPAAVLRLARLARGADVLYACTLSSFPYCLLAGRLARVPQVVHVYSSYGDGAAYRKHLLGRARHVVAPSADSLALARRALGEFAAGTRARVVYNGMDVERIACAAAAPLPAGLALGGGPTVGMVGHLDARKNPAATASSKAANMPAAKPSSEKRVARRSRAAVPTRARRTGSRRSAAIAAASAGASPGGTRHPLTPSSSISGMPPTALATMGRPSAMPSRRASGKGSRSAGWTSRSSRATRGNGFARKPVTATASATPSARARSRTLRS